MNITILIPVFNDFKSVSKLIEEIDINISDFNASFSVIIVNDASTEEKNLETKNLNNIKSLKLINMRNNKGHARCIAAGLKYILENEDFDYVIPMDGDGEDRPEEIINFVEKIKNNIDLIKTFVLKTLIIESECIIKFLKLILEGPKYLVPLSDGTPALSFETLASAPEKLLQVAFSLTIFSTTDLGKQV